MNDRGIEVRDLITHLQTLDPTARMVFTTDGYTDTPVCTKDFVRQASGVVEIILPKPIIKEIETSYKNEIEDLEDEVDQLESQIKSKDERIENLVSALATIHRVSSEVLGS